MADILIRGMEMPKDGRITIQIGSDGAVYFVEECTILAEKYEKSSHAIPLPAGHGELADVAVLMMKTGGMPYKSVVRRLLMSAPTIVPAEGGREDG